MRINKDVQYAMLFVLYTKRVGRATVEGAAKNLKISKSFLEQITRKLRMGGLIKAIKGPGGGYELKQGIIFTIDIFNAISPIDLFLEKDKSIKSHLEYDEVENVLASLNENVSELLAKPLVNNCE